MLIHDTAMVMTISILLIAASSAHRNKTTKGQKYRWLDSESKCNKGCSANVFHIKSLLDAKVQDRCAGSFALYIERISVPFWSAPPTRKPKKIAEETR